MGRARLRLALLLFFFAAGAARANATDAVAPELAFAMGRLQAGDWPGAYAAGKLAFATAETGTERYHAARVLSIAALSQGQGLRTRFWLRRAADLAPTPREARLAERNHDLLQAASPWRFSAGFGLRSSSNVNNGATSPYNIIEGVPLVGLIDGRGRALSGYLADSFGSVSRRIGGSDRSTTRVSLGVFDRRVRLTDEAKTLAPEASSSDYGRTGMELALAHQRGGFSERGRLGAQIGIGRDWMGGAPYSSTGGLSLSYSHAAGRDLGLHGRVSATRRSYEQTGATSTLGAQAGMDWLVGAGNRLSLEVGLRDERADNDAFDNRGATLRLGMALGQPLGPVGVSASLGAGRTEYEAYRLGFIPVPDGRRDDVVWAELDLMLAGHSYAGFAPTITLRTAETHSNVSRFTTRETSLSLGIASRF